MHMRLYVLYMCVDLFRVRVDALCICVRVFYMRPVCYMRSGVFHIRSGVFYMNVCDLLSRILVPASWIQYPGSSILDPGSGTQDTMICSNSTQMFV